MTDATMRSRAGRRLLLPLAAVCLIFASCANNWNWRGEGFHDDSTVPSGKDFRRHAASGDGAGLDQRAVEIERDLGIK